MLQYHALGRTEIIYGEVSERFKELVLKTSDAERHRGFESHPLRHQWTEYTDFHYAEVLKWWRGAPAKGVGRVTGARVQISPSAPRKVLSKDRTQTNDKPTFEDKRWV